MSTNELPPEIPPTASAVTATPRLRAALVRQVRNFAVIGVISTAAYIVLYALLRPHMPAAVANVVALVVTAVGNTAANRRLTFEIQSRDGLAHDHAGGLIALAIAVAITTVAIAGLQFVAPHHAQTTELVVRVGANSLATVARFFLLRSWLDRTHRSLSLASSASERTLR